MKMPQEMAKSNPKRNPKATQGKQLEARWIGREARLERSEKTNTKSATRCRLNHIAMHSLERRATTISYSVLEVYH